MDNMPRKVVGIFMGINPTSVDKARKMLGHRVRVTLDTNVIVTGQLLGFGDSGEFEIIDERDLFLHYCWPLLAIEDLGEYDHGAAPGEPSAWRKP